MNPSAAGAARPVGRYSVQRRSDPLVLAAAILALWQAASHMIGVEDFASPWETLITLIHLLGSAAFWPNAAATGLAFVYALAVTLLGGLALGLLLGYFRLAGEVFDPIIGACYAIPKITLYPIVLLLFGLSLSAKVAFGVLHGIFPMIIFTMGGVKNVRPVLLNAARTLRLSPLATMRHVLIPAALPEIFTGFRVGFSLALLGTLIGEMFASDQGLGFLLMRGISQGDSATIMAISLLLFGLSSVAGWGLLRIDHRLHRYRQTAPSMHRGEPCDAGPSPQKQ